MKTIRLVYFARLREALGINEEVVRVDDSVGNVAKLTGWLRRRGEIWNKELGAGSAVRVAVNLDMAQPDTAIADRDEVAFFPPMTGG